MHSHEQLLRITGEPVWADRCEEIAFNSLPSSMTPDLKGVHSLTGPNQVQLDRTNKAPTIGKEGDAFSYSPHVSACCQHNVSFGWPYFAEHIWLATPGNGLAAAMYAPSVVVAKVGSLGRNVRITQFTDYPFGDTVKFTIGLTNRVRFPLRFRIPSWCASPEATLNNLPARLMFASEGWATIDRIWRDGDHIELKFPMETRVRAWGMTREALSVSRGPLWFSLQIKERWQRFGGTEQWPGFEVFPDSPWNYALDAASLDPGMAFRVELRNAGAAAQPFSLEGAPLVLKANAKRIPRWQQEANGLIGEIPFDKSTAEPLEAVTLVPMGAARLRVTVFPKGSSEPPHDPGLVQ